MPITIPISIQVDLLNQFLSQINELLARYSVDCFISYSWGDRSNKKKVSRLQEDLTRAGISVLLDLQHNHQINSSIFAFTEKINSVKYVILAGSRSLKNKYTKRTNCILNQEIAKIYDKFKVNQNSVVGVSLDGQIRSCLPGFLEDKVIGNYTHNFDIYAKTTLDLLEYFAPDIIKQDVKTIIENFNNLIIAIKYNMSQKNLLEHQSINSLQLVTQIAINVDDLLKKDCLQKLDSDPSCNVKKINFFKSFVYLIRQNHNHITTKTEKHTCNVLVDDFFNSTKHIIIQGDSGMGKSTLCKIIVYLWASNNKLLDFKFVFFIKASNLNKSRYPVFQDKEYKEMDIILKECFLQQTLTEMSSVVLEINIYSNKNKILWIIDDSDSSLSNIPEHLQDVFKRIINSHYTILTSRNHSDKTHDEIYQAIGFSEDTQLSYIDLFFDYLGSSDNKSIKENLLHFLSCNYLVKKLCLIPMYLKFICNIWLNKLNAANVNTSITTLYQEIFISMINKLLEKEHLQPDNLRTEYEISNRLHLPLLAIKNISFFIHKKNCDIFTYEELEKNSAKLFSSSKQKQLFPYLFDDILKIGIISRNGNKLKFIDSSLKMFFVAKYLIDGLQPSTSLYDHQNFKDKFAWFVRNYKYIKNNDLLFVFVSGLLNSLNKNNDFSGSLFLKEAIMLFWGNIFSNNLDFVGINHICLLLKCLKETDYNITFNEKPEIKSYIYEHLPKILEYIRVNNIYRCINMFLSVFNDPYTMEIIINLVLLRDTINFIAHTDKNYRSSILSNLLLVGESYYSKQILGFVYEKLSTTLNIGNDIVSKYFAFSTKDTPSNEKFLTKLLQGSLKNKRTAIEIILIQNFDNQNIIMLLHKLASDMNPYRTRDIIRKILQIDASNKQQLIDNEDIINELIEMENLSCLCIDVLYNLHGYTAKFSEILRITYEKTISSKIKAKTESIRSDLEENLKEDNDLWHAAEIYYDNSMSTDYDTDCEIGCEADHCEIGYEADPREYIKYINANYKSINWQIIFLDVETIVKLGQEILKFLIDNNIFLVNTPLINLINAYAEAYLNNVSSLATLIIKRIFFNCEQEVLTIKNTGIMVYSENIVFLEVNKCHEGAFISFINAFTKLFYDFAKTHHFNLEHKQTSFTPGYELQICESTQRSTYVCAYAELSEPGFKAIENSIHSEQGISDEDHSTSSVSKFKHGFFGYYTKDLSFKKSDSKPPTPISTEVQDSIVTTTITRQRLCLRG